MKIETWKKILAGVAVCSMVAGVASAATVWNPAANGINSPDVGYWDEPLNWTAGLPGASELTATFNVPNAAECVVTNTQAGFRVIQGDNGADDAGVLRIASGGDLTAQGDWSAIGFNKKARCIVEEGGVYSFENHAWIGHVDAGDGTLDVHGTFNVSGMFGLGFSGGTGKATVYDNGRLNLSQFNETQSISGNSILDIWGGGLMTLSGDHAASISNNITAGKILGNRLTNNLYVVVAEEAPGVTNTVVSVKPSIPNLAGLTPAEAEEVLTVFGYIVGTTTEGSAPNGITGRVIASVPAAGTATNDYPSGSAINIVIQEAGSVPSVIGLDYAAATNLVVQSGFSIGTETETYVFDAIPGLVTGQDPAAGTAANPGDSVSIDFYERAAAKTVTSANTSGDWMSAGIWDGGVVPERETQGFEVRIRGGSVVTLTNKVAMKQFRGGINGADAGPFQMDILDGGHIVAAQLSSADYASIGDNAQGGLNVYSNGIFESRETIRFGWGKGSGQSGLSTLNIDGGTVLANGWMSFGKNDGSTSTETVIQNGGVLFIDRFRDDMINGVITMHKGTFTMTGTSTTQFETALASGMIVFADGYQYTLDTTSGNAVLRSYLPSFDSWAEGWGEDIGAETGDHDLDGAENLYEYALNGDPTDDQDTGQDPVLVNNGGVFEYIHLLRDDDTNLVYTVQMKNDLVNEVEWQDAGILSTSTNVTGNEYNVLTNIIDTASDHTFIRLEITNP